MAESRSWAIIEAVAAQLRTITIASGYLTDVGAHVWTSDAQRDSDDALGILVRSESIAGPGVDHERPGKPVRNLVLLLEAQIATALDDAAEQIHQIIEDVETCIADAAKQPPLVPYCTNLHVADIAILDQPEGLAVIAMQARVAARYFR